MKHSKIVYSVGCILCLMLVLLLGPGLAEDASVITLPADTVEVAEEAFYGDTTITKIVIPEGVEVIGPKAFGGNENLKEVVLPESGAVAMSVDSLDGSKNAALGEGSVLYYKIDGDSATVTKYEGTAEEITIPGTVNGVPVKAIADRVFKGNENLKKLVLSEGLETVGVQAFMNCVNLTDITFPKSLKTLNNEAFNSCGKASKEKYYFLLPPDMEEIAGSTGAGWGAFDGVTGILVSDVNSATSRLLSDGGYVFALTSHYQDGLIYYYVKATVDNETVYRLYLYDYTGSAEELEIPAGDGLYAVSRVPAGGNDPWKPAFYNNTTLKKVVIPEGVELVEDQAFRGCTNLTDITFPKSIKTLKNQCFRDCGSASEEKYYIFLPSTLETIAPHTGASWGAFDGITGTLVCDINTATSKLLSDGGYVFAIGTHYSDGLTYYYVKSTENDETVYRLYLYDYTGTAEALTIPAGDGLYAVSRVPAGGNDPWKPAFYNNTTLKKVVIPEGVELVEQKAFKGCTKLTDVTFPSTVEVLKNECFRDCGKDISLLHYFLLPPNMTAIAGSTGASWGAFDGCNAILVCDLESDTSALLSDGAYNFAVTSHYEDGLLYRYEKATVDSETVRYLYLYDYIGTAEELEIPSGEKLYGISRTPPGGSDTWKPAFSGNTTLKKVVIPSGVKIIQDSAFKNCTALCSITLPAGLEVMKNHCFENTGTAQDDRFIVVLPDTVIDFQANNGAGWACFNKSKATLVASRDSYCAGELYNGWWQFYNTVANAESQTNLIRQPTDDEDFEYYGNI